MKFIILAILMILFAIAAITSFVVVVNTSISNVPFNFTALWVCLGSFLCVGGLFSFGVYRVQKEDKADASRIKDILKKY